MPCSAAATTREAGASGTLRRASPRKRTEPSDCACAGNHTTAGTICPGREYVASLSNCSTPFWSTHITVSGPVNALSHSAAASICVDLTARKIRSTVRVICAGFVCTGPGTVIKRLPSCKVRLSRGVRPHSNGVRPTSCNAAATVVPMAPGPKTATTVLISVFMNADSLQQNLITWWLCPSQRTCNILHMNKENGNRISEGEQRLQQWLGSIHARSGDLAASEAKVVDLLLVDPLFVCTSTAAQVATRAGVSPPTVIRAARAIGFTGFTELKIEIARARGTAQFFAPPEVLTADATLASVLETSIRAGVDALTALSGAIEISALDEAVDLIQSARQVFAFGAGPSATVAADAVFRLRTAGVITVSIQDYLSAMIAARLLGPGDVIIVVSSTGRTSSTLSIADAASSAGASLIAITNQYDTPLATLANVSLVVGGMPLPAQMAAAGSRLAQLVVIDTLVAALTLRDKEQSRRAERAGIDLPDMS
ncbi:RpiR family transcriptional regulator [Klebsiella pneumoniae]|nr:RpiR family transcriptional regulator [Klebsiella pneumoniae]